MLLVEDDPPIRALVRQVLTERGYGVLEAADGAAALALVERERSLDLVLLDLWMPVMDGWQFAQAYWDLRLEGVPPPLLVLTAEKGASAARHAEQIKACGFLTKPFDLDELVAAVERCARPGPAPAKAPDAPTTRRTQPAPREPWAATRSRAEITRQHDLERLRAHLERVKRDLGRMRLEVTRVAEIEDSRGLTRDEARCASQLKLETERLRLELENIRTELSGPRDRGDGRT